MKERWLGDRSPAYFLVARGGEEVMGGLLTFAEEREIKAARVWGIGGFEYARLGFYEPEAKDYTEHSLEEPMEVLGLHGNITTFEGRPRVHLHAVIGLSDLSVRGGHLLEARVRPTLELFLAEAQVELVREMDEDLGVPVVRP